MNKLLVSDIIDLKNGEYEINSKTPNLKINIKGEVSVYLINYDLNNLEISMQDNAILKIYLFNQNVKQDLNVTINQDNLSKVYFNASIKNNVNNKLVINNNLRGNDNESVLNIRSVSDKDLSQIIINVLVAQDTSHNIAIEDIKGINNGGFVYIEPNIECLSNDVSANHLTTISNVNKDELDYLMSKGITYEMAHKILLNGFIYSNMDEYIKEMR